MEMPLQFISVLQVVPHTRAILGNENISDETAIYIAKKTAKAKRNWSSHVKWRDSPSKIRISRGWSGLFRLIRRFFLSNGSLFGLLQFEEFCDNRLPFAKFPPNSPQHHLQPSSTAVINNFQAKAKNLHKPSNDAGSWRFCENYSTCKELISDISESVCRGSNPCSAAKKGRLFFEKRDGPFLLCKKARF